jgi:hypothetical protein
MNERGEKLDNVQLNGSEGSSELQLQKEPEWQRRK